MPEAESLPELPFGLLRISWCRYQDLMVGNASTAHDGVVDETTRIDMRCYPFSVEAS